MPPQIAAKIPKMLDPNTPPDQPQDPITAALGALLPPPPAKDFASYAADPANFAKLPDNSMAGRSVFPPPEPANAALFGNKPSVFNGPASTPFDGPLAQMQRERSQIDTAKPAPIAGPPKAPGMTGKSFLGMSLATLADELGSALTHNQPTVGHDWLSKIQALNDYNRTLPTQQEQANTQRDTGLLSSANTESEINLRNTQNKNLAMVGPPGRQELLKAIGEEAEAGSLSKQDLVNKYVYRGAPYGLQRQDIVDYINSLPAKKPQFPVKDGVIQPIVYQGQNYGPTPGENEPPEIQAARKVANPAAQSEQDAKLDPIIRGELGPVPTDPAQRTAYFQKAEAAKIRMAAAPRVEMTLERPVQVADPTTGAVTYQAAGQAMKSGALAPGSIPFQAEKSVTKDFTSGGSAKTLNAFNTATEHLKLLDQLADGLHNGDVQIVNSLGNKFATATGSQAPTNFEMAKNAVAGEVAKTFKGNATEGEIAAINSTINQAMSPQQLKGAIATATSLMESKRQALKTQYEQGMQGKPAFEGSGPQVGQSIKLKGGKTAKIKAVHPDGSFDVE